MWKRMLNHRKIKKRDKYMLFMNAISELVPIDADGYINVLIETPKGSRQKYDLNHDLGLFQWSLELPAGMSFPYSFGFVPNTLAEDGDALDIILLLDGEVPQGTLVKAHAIGVLQMEQDEGEAGMVRNDRVIAVANLSHAFAGVRELDDMREGFMWDMEEFFLSYNRMLDRKIKIIDRGTASEADKLLKDAISRHQKNES